MLDKGKPDYSAELLYSRTDTYRYGTENNLMLGFNSIPGIDHVERMWKGNDLHLYYEGIENDEILNAFRESLPDRYRSDYFEGYGNIYDIKEVDKAFITNLYALDFTMVDRGYFVDKQTGEKVNTENIDNYNAVEWHRMREYTYGEGTRKIVDSIAEGSFDEDQFLDGREVILLMPMYSPLDKKTKAEMSSVVANSTFQSTMANVLEASGKYYFSYNKADKDTMQGNQSIKVGDTIWISADQELIEGQKIVHKYDPVEVKAGAIIRYFPGESLWPFSDTRQGYSVISSWVFMSNIYTGFDSKGMVNLDKTGISFINQTICKVKLGRTLYYLYGNDRMNLKTDTKLVKRSNDDGFILTNYRIGNLVMLSEAKNNTAITALLCLTSAALSMIILYNILSSRAEQKKKRMGILQSIGVTKWQLRRVNLNTGIRKGLLSIAITYVALAAVFILSTVYAPGEGVTPDIFIDRLRRYYPVGLLVEITVLYFIMTVLMYSLPFRRIIKNSPVENITE